MKRCLVTGANGYVGSNVAKCLSQSGFQVRASVKNPSGVGRVSEHCSDVVYFDLLRDSNYTNVLCDIDVVVHCAGLAHSPRSLVSEQGFCLYKQINAIGTLQLARNALKMGVNRFIYISSISVLGNESTGPLSFESPASPHDAPAKSKFEAEEMLKELFFGTDADLVIIRPPLVYGPSAPGNIALLWRIVRSGLPLPFGALHNSRSFVAIDNLVSLICICCEHPNAAGGVFLVSDNNDVSTSQLLRLMYIALGKRSKLLYVPYPILLALGKVAGKSDVITKLNLSLQVDLSHTMDSLSWSPTSSMEDVLFSSAQVLEASN